MEMLSGQFGDKMEVFGGLAALYVDPAHPLQPLLPACPFSHCGLPWPGAGTEGETWVQLPLFLAKPSTLQHRAVAGQEWLWGSPRPVSQVQHWGQWVPPFSTCSHPASWAHLGAGWARSRQWKEEPVCHQCCCPQLCLAHCSVTAHDQSRGGAALGQAPCCGLSQGQRQ